MKISEIFYSIQGEGIYAGVPTVFVRLQGCNFLPGLGCVWCDTKYAQDYKDGSELSILDIVKKVYLLSPWHQSWVCITGGEPLFQIEELEGLVRKLREEGYRIEIETNGTVRKPGWYTLVDSWVADIKCPSSGVCGKSLEKEWFDTRVMDQIKFVVQDKADLDFTREIINRNIAKNPIVLVSPVLVGPYWFGSPWLQEVAEFCKKERVRFSLQVHKVVWGNKKGV